MRLLFDQNISFRIIKKIEDIFPGSEQTKRLNLDKASDFEIWEYARKNNFCIVTFDSDFIDISVLKGSPPKIIWLRAGNTTTNSIAEMIQANQEIIKEFMTSVEVAYLELVQATGGNT
jgi:predicted nuclease of predicted toxin-antitoxin system